MDVQAIRANAKKARTRIFEAAREAKKAGDVREVVRLLNLLVSYKPSRLRNNGL